MTQLIIQLHRYIGIPMSVIVVIWFLSGIVMMYTRGMPSLTDEQSLALKSAIPLTEIAITPGEALRRNNIRLLPQELMVESLLLRPAYRFGDLTLFADNGELFEGADENAGRDIVSIAFGIPSARVHFTGELFEPDQWTITESRHLPVLKFVLDDDAATEAYVSVATGEVVLATNRASRLLAWIGAIPHWIYFTSLRNNQPAWFWTIIILSSIGCLISGLGLVLMFTQFKKSTPFSLRNSIRYMGLMRWHYLTGVFFGLFALTWSFSGLLSMDPFDWNQRRAIDIDVPALNKGAPLTESVDMALLSSFATAPSPKRLELRNVFGRLSIVTHHAGDGEPRAAAPDPGESINTGEIVSALEAITGAEIIEVELLGDYDSYYYDRDHVRPLPVLRVAFDDPAGSTAYVDPATGRIVARTHRLSRVDRWLFNGLHSLDFGFWYDKRPLWDVVVISLSIGGLALSSLGLVLGVRRIKRWVASRQP